MQKSISLTLVVLLSIGNSVFAVPGIDVGSHELLPDTAGQTIDILVTGGDAVQGLNFRAQVGDGFPDVPGSSIDGPNITAIDIVGSGTIFFGNNVGQSDVESRPQAWDQQTVTSAGFVNASGVLARMTFDTTGFLTPMTWDLTLSGGFLGDTNFGLIAAEITNGSIFIGGATTNPAIPALSPNPANLGNFHVGDTAEQTFTVSNNAAAGAEDLNASFGGTTGDVNSAPGSVSGLAPGASDNSSMAAGIDTSTAGAKSGTATVDYESVGSGALPSEIVDVTANVFRLADPNTVAPVDVGNVHVGDTAEQALSISNQAAADGFSESLNASAGGNTGDATGSGSVSGLAPGATDTTGVVVGIDTSTAGAKSGTQTVNFESDGTGSSELGTTALSSQDVAVSGTVYRLADPSAATPNPVDFGILHVGDPTSQSLAVSNLAAADGFSESLNVATGSTGDATGSGAISQLAPGATDSSTLSASIDTSSPGFKSGTVDLSFASDGTGSSGLGVTSLGSESVDVSAQVNAFAEPILKKLDGAGTLSHTGTNEYTLNFGDIVLSSGDRMAELGVMNDTVAPADDLAGTWILTTLDFSNSGFDPFGGLAPGDTLGGLLVGLSSGILGDFSGMIQFDPRSELNLGESFSQDLDSITLLLEGSIVEQVIDPPNPNPAVPEPSTFVLCLLAFAGLLPMLRRRRNRS